MSTDTRLSMALHCHQPVGNFPEVFREITAESYKPFLEAFREAEDAGRVSFHASGPLLEWWSHNDPSMIDLIGELVEEERLELLTAGFYEPILSLITRADRRRQVEKHLELLDTLFESRPSGLWLTERIWQPDLPEDLAPLGIDYTIVDDFHFTCAGWERDELSGYYTTESNGKTLDIFPISQELRYRIPFHDVDEIVDYLDSSSHGVLTMADDGEKFGSWPDTQSWVYEDGWLERFLGACEEERIQLQSLGETHKNSTSNGRCYLPTASYQEMLEWALPADAHREYRRWKHENPEMAEAHGRGGFFQHFLVKYEESNRLHKRMQWLSQQIDKEDEPEAADHLMAGQCNDTYWHGVFGGLFLPHLRSRAWENLCEAYASSECGTAEPVQRDFDRDGRREIVFGDDSQFLVIDPHHGAELQVLELYPAGRNVLDSLTRRWESYLSEESDDGESEGEVDTIHHRTTDVPSDWLESWAEDPVPRAGFQPVVLDGDGTSADDLCRQEGVEYLGRNQSPSTVRLENGEVHVRWNGDLKAVNYDPHAGSLDWSGEVEERVEGPWGVMSTIGFHSASREDARLYLGDETHAVNETLDRTVTSVECVDNTLGLRLTMDSPDPVRLLSYPVETISRSEQDAERIFQGTALVLVTDRSRLRIDVDWSDFDGTE